MTSEIAVQEKLFNPLLFILLGIVFWLVGIIFIRVAGEALFVKGSPWHLLLFVTYIPIAWIFIKLVTVAGKVSGNGLLRAVSLSALTAALLDGITFTWFQDWLGLEQVKLLLAAAWLLWGTGVGIGAGYWASR
jgi:hypothetical protein